MAESGSDAKMSSGSRTGVDRAVKVSQPNAAGAIVQTKLMPKLPGQNSPNPCVFFESCGNNRFTLRHGCYLASAYLIISGIIGFAAYGAILVAAVELACTSDKGKMCKLDTYVTTHAGERISGVVAHLFALVAGVVMAASTGTLNKLLCVMSAILSASTVLFQIAVAIVHTIVVVRAPVGSQQDKDGLVVEAWALALFLLVTHGYCCICAVCFFIQVKTGEYAMLVPVPMITPEVDEENGGDSPGTFPRPYFM